MAVNLSPIWGAGAQLLDNSGNVLSGGKIYTYAAGTTTPVTTYTSNAGNVANSNPIILNSAGRVPYEIWLTDGQNYKFVLKDSNDVLIGTWDNLSGINSNFIAYTNEQEIQTATAGQTVFNLTTMNYLPGTNSLSVFVDGVNQYGPGSQYAYEETDSNTVTFASGLHVGAEVKFTSSQIQNSGVADASQISYTYPDSNAVAQNVEERLAQYVSVKDFGAVGDGVIDDTVAIQNAATAALEAGKSLFFPSGQYFIASTIEIDNSTYPQWSTLSWVGEEFVTGNALYQNSVSGVKAGSVIVTDGTSAVQITMDNFWNESVRFNNLSFYNQGSIGLSAAIIVNKDSTSYVRGQEFTKLGFYNFDTCIVLRGQQVDINNNYFGSTVISENFAYECGAGLYLDSAYVNLFQVSNSLYHGCTKYGIQITSSAGAVMSIANTHFEGCEPAGILAGGLTTVLNLDGVSAESTGTTSGNGILKTSASINALTVNVSNSGYNQSGFALMPHEFRLNRGATINASCPVQASGYGWNTNTPEMVTPVVSNNATYNQTDVSTFAMCPLHDTVARNGNRVFDKFAGYNTGSQTSLTPPNSVNLPEGVRSRYVGTNSTVSLIGNITDTYTAASNGYVYFSWMGSFSAVDNGFNASGAQVLVNGSNKLVTGNTFGPYAGNFVVLVPISNGQTLSRTELSTYFAPSWVTGVYGTFEPTLLNMNDAASGYPRVTTTNYSLATANTLSLVDYTDASTPFAINVKLFFNGGSKGYKEYVITGDGASTATRTYTSVASVVVAGVAVTTNTGGNSQMYNIDVANTSGSTITVTKQVTYIS